MEFAKKINAIFQNTSAARDTGINNLFEKLGKKLLNPKIDLGMADKESIKLDKKNNNNNQERKKGCC